MAEANRRASAGRIVLVGCLALVAGTRGLFAQAIGDSPRGPIIAPASLREFLEPLILRQLDTRKIAGAVVTIVKDGAVVFSEGYGRSDVSTGRRMTPDTLVRLASVTKTLTALAVMQLVESGRLEADRDVNAYVDFAVPSVLGRAPVTIRRLLSHQSGFEQRWGNVGSWTGERPPLGPYLARHMPPRLRQSDDVVAYSNFNYALAAYVVERTSGQLFERYLQAYIFDPLLMTRTTARQPVPDALLAEVSNGYVRSDLPPTRVSMGDLIVYEVGSAGVTTSASDMGRLLVALLEDNPRIVSRAALDTMMTPQTRTPRGAAGLGLFSPTSLSGGDPFFGHAGNTGGFHSTLAILPQERFGVFASYNSEGIPEAVWPQDELLAGLADRYFAEVKVSSSGGPFTSDVASVYRLTGGVDSNLFKLGRLFNQIAVRAVAGTLTIRPAVFPFGEPLNQIAPGLFRWRGRDVAFAGSGQSAVMQVGSPLGLMVPVSWSERATIVVPTVSICLLVAAAAVLSWPVKRLRRKLPIDALSCRLQSVTRLALLFDLVAIGAALWLVFRDWPLAAASSRLVAPLALGIYALAWTGVFLTPVAMWNAIRFARRGGGLWAPGREVLLAVVVAVLGAFCVWWRIAGTTLTF